MPHGVFLPSWSDKITVKSQGHTLGQIVGNCHYFRGRNGWKSTNLMKLNTIILSGLRPRFKEPLTGVIGPTACWSFPREKLSQEPTPSTGTNSHGWKSLDSLENSLRHSPDSQSRGQWRKINLGRSHSWWWTFLTGLVSEILTKTNSLKPQQHLENPCHANFLLNLWWRRLITSLPPPPFNPALLELARCGKNSIWTQTCHSTGESYKGWGLSQAFWSMLCGADQLQMLSTDKDLIIPWTRGHELRAYF